MFYGYRSILPTLVVALLLGACATVNWDYPRMRSSAFAYPETTSVGALFQEAAAKYPGLSGFSLLNIGRALFSPASDGRLSRKDAGRANQAAKMMDDGTLPGSAYRVTLDKDDRLVWTAENNREKVQYDTDPGTNIWERLLFDFVGMLPIEDQL